MQRRTLVWIIAVPVALLAAFLVWSATRGVPERGEATTAQPRTSVTVAQVGEFFLYLPLYYAKDRKFFEREGLDVRLVDSGGDEKSVAAVVSGAADFGVGDPTFAAIANEQGQRVRIVASVVNGVPFWGVAKRRDIAEVRTPSALKGLTVGTFPKPSTAYTLQARMFREGGLEPRIREAQFGSLLPLLDSGGADVVLELEPNVSTAVANGARVVYSLAAKYPDFAITGVTVLDRTIRERPDVVRRFVRALDAAERDAHAHPDQLVAFARQRFSSVPAPVAEAAARRMLSSNVLPTSATVSPKGWSAAVALRAASGDLRNPSAAAGAVDNSLLR